MESVEVEVKKEDKKYGKYDKYEIESAARTLRESEEIKADEEKMKYVKKCLEKESKAAEKAYKSISDMREDYKKMDDEEGDEE